MRTYNIGKENKSKVAANKNRIFPGLSLGKPYSNAVTTPAREFQVSRPD
jgi:hypothetical protein